MITSFFISIFLLSTPTPTPTPAPIPGNGGGVASFSIPPGVPPWPYPPTPGIPVATPQPTLYAATAIHATDYPGTATAQSTQIAAFVAPIGAIGTPAAALVAVGPTPGGGTLGTGLDPIGSGEITLATISDNITTGISDVVGSVKVLILDIANLATYSPWLAPIPLILLLPPIIGLFLSLIILIAKAGRWLWDFVIDIALVISGFFP